VIVVGAGPVGLTAALDLALQNIPVLLLDEDNTVAEGSRAICFSKRTLEIMDRLGCADALQNKGVTWNLGNLYFRDRPVYSFNLLPEQGHKRPAFINLQQYYFEAILIRRLQQVPAADLRWQSKVVGVQQSEDGVVVQVQTPDGVYRAECEYVIAADGAKSTLRGLLGLKSHGQTFQDHFLIADVRMPADLPTQRHFWFDPPFHPGQTALLHRQADDLWRVDFQLGRGADPEIEKQPERVMARIEAMLGPDAPVEVEWSSVYTFKCMRLEKFVHGRVIFAGDSAHQVSPFGARGGNGGIQDADNLIWKLRLILEGKAPRALLVSYDFERGRAADENIAASTGSTDFISPKSRISLAFRDATLSLAREFPFARSLVNSGRLSIPAILRDSPLNTPDTDAFTGTLVPGAPCADAPVVVEDKSGWLLDFVGGDFTLLCWPGEAAEQSFAASLVTLLHARLPLKLLVVGGIAPVKALRTRQLTDLVGLLQQRYDARPGTVYLIRPDQHVAARWRAFSEPDIRASLARATATFEPVQHGDKPASDCEL
jgi:3-(3-hydroxy-phenyl)propionate hydroxylase